MALRRRYPEATIALEFSTPFQLLVATVLSAQCTDVRVNEVTKVLFDRFATVADYYRRPQSQLEAIIRPTGFFRQKAKSIREAARLIDEKFGGEVPQTMEELVSLPGVGRKTANVILGNAFNIPGLPVDTHVTRVSNRIGLVDTADPVKIETLLTGLIAKRHWTQFSHLLIWHGRQICKARKPLCPECPVLKYCDYGRSAVKGIDG